MPVMIVDDSPPLRQLQTSIVACPADGVHQDDGDHAVTANGAQSHGWTPRDLCLSRMAGLDADGPPKPTRRRP